MENKAKGPEELLAEWEERRPLYYDNNKLESDRARFCSVMVDLLRWAVTQMPPHCIDYDNKQGDAYEAFNTAIDDCKATLLRLADEICQNSTK